MSSENEPREEDGTPETEGAKAEDAGTPEGAEAEGAGTPEGAKAEGAGAPEGAKAEGAGESETDEEPEEPEANEDATDDALSEPAEAIGSADAGEGSGDDDAKDDDEDEGPPLLAPGNPLRVRGAITMAISLPIAFLLMAKHGQLRFGVPLGFLAIAVATFGVMDFLGTFDDSEERVERSTTLGALRMPLVNVVATTVLFGLALFGAQSGVSQQWVWGLAVTAAFIAWVAATFDLGAKLGPWRLDEHGEERPLLRRHGFWVMALAGALYLPFLGSFSLWDPWETHYGEVARDPRATTDLALVGAGRLVLVEADPQLLIQSIAMASLGTHYQPGGDAPGRRPGERAPRGRAGAGVPDDGGRDVLPLGVARLRPSRGSSALASRRCPTGSSSRIRR